MRISSIETFLLEAPIQPGFGWSQGWTDKRQVGLVKLVTADGIVGWGEGSVRLLCANCPPGVRAPVARRGPDAAQRALAENVPPFHNGNVAGGIGGSAISAVDTALWDIAGKASGLPVSALLGGRVRDRIAVYATGLYYTAEGLASEGRALPQRLLDEARMYVELGFAGMKTKVGGLPLAQDVRRVAAIRRNNWPRHLPHGGRQSGL